MDRCAAIRAALLENLAAQRAELPARWIRRGTIGPQKSPPVDCVRRIRRTLRIRTEPAQSRRRQTSARELVHGCFLLQRNPELLRQLPDHRVIQFRPVPLLEHRQRRLLAADLGRKFALGQLRRPARIPQPQANLWT